MQSTERLEFYALLGHKIQEGAWRFLVGKVKDLFQLEFFEERKIQLSRLTTPVQIVLDHSEVDWRNVIRSHPFKYLRLILLWSVPPYVPKLPLACF